MTIAIDTYPGAGLRAINGPSGGLCRSMVTYMLGRFRAFLFNKIEG